MGVKEDWKHKNDGLKKHLYIKNNYIITVKLSMSSSVLLRGETA